MTRIPVVIVHVGEIHDYFRRSIYLTTKKNDVVVISNIDNKEILQKMSRVSFVNVADLHTPEIDEFRTCFVNYSDNHEIFERFCFLRVFYMKQYLEKTGRTKLFHADSDCVVAEDVNDFFTEESPIAFSVPDDTDDPFMMVGCIHNALLDRPFCETFIRLCFDIYLTKTKFHYISDKINWHTTNKIPGGICDMTMYYLMYVHKLVGPITNLYYPIQKNQAKPGDEFFLFDHNLNSSVGFQGKNTFQMGPHLKRIDYRNGRVGFLTTRNEFLYTASMHFQGNAKQLLAKLGELQ